MSSYQSIADSYVRRHTGAYDTFLRELNKASGAVYYDAVADKANRDNYYRGIRAESSTPNELYQQLSGLLEKTHTTRLTYNDARHQYLYPNVDLQPNRKLKSIYSGEEFAPEQIMQADLAITEGLLATAQQQFGGMRGMNEAVFLSHLEALEASATYNAEHSVPQSWFGKKDPMKSDLHHLFTCETLCNEFRANLPFFDFPGTEGTVRRGCGAADNNKFEPAQGRGTVARATLYFLLRYPREINNSPREYTPDRIPALLKWHHDEPAGEYEHHRNAEIFRVQGNRNPLIDFPDWSERLNFLAGLG